MSSLPTQQTPDSSNPATIPGLLPPHAARSKSKRLAIGLAALFVLLLIPGQINTVPSANSTFLTDLQNFLREEEADRYVFQHNDFVYSGCTHGTGALAQTISSCVAFVEGKYVSTSGSITYAPTTNPDTCWVALDDSLTGTPGGLGNFSRVSGTKFFLDCTSATTPTAPTGTLLILTVVTTLTAITSVSGVAVTDAHDATTATRGIAMLHAAQFGAVCDNTANDTAALQATLDYADGDDGALTFIDRKCNWTPGSITWDTADDVVFDKSSASGMLMWASAPRFSLRNPTSGGTAAGTYGFDGLDSASNYDQFGNISVSRQDVTSGSEDGRFELQLRRNGTLLDSAIIAEDGTALFGSGIVEGDLTSYASGTLVTRVDVNIGGVQLQLHNGNTAAGATAGLQMGMDDTSGTLRPAGIITAVKVNSWATAGASDGQMNLSVYDGGSPETGLRLDAADSAVSIPANYVMTLGTVNQATLAAWAASNGSLIYCSDCTINSATCVGGSTGARATRINGAWRCD